MKYETDVSRNVRAIAYWQVPAARVIGLRRSGLSMGAVYDALVKEAPPNTTRSSGVDATVLGFDALPWDRAVERIDAKTRRVFLFLPLSDGGISVSIGHRDPPPSTIPNSVA